MMGRGLADLRGAVVAVTGGARGIGLATAASLAARGARVAIGDVDGELAARVAEPFGGRAATLDVRDRASFARFLDQAEDALGPLYALVNNAGVMPMGPFLDEGDAVTDLQIDVNLRGVIHGMRLAIPGMVGRGRGHVVNVASLGGRLPVPGAAVYTATKHAVVGLTEAVRAELRRTGVHVTVVLPSRVATELAAGTRGGRGVPTVTPNGVARAIVRALERPRPVVVVPRALRPAPLVYALAPERVRELLRRAVRDDRILTDLDRGARAGYDERVAGLADSRPVPPSSKGLSTEPSGESEDRLGDPSGRARPGTP